MATTEPLTGATVYQQTDAALGGQQLGDVVGDLAPFVTPRFTSTSTRDTQYAAFVAAGGVIKDGMTCWCDTPGSYYDRIGGAWVQRQIAWTQFVPTWTCTGGAPVLGTGSLTGWQVRNGKTCHFQIELKFGSTTTGGTGGWSFANLPFAAASTREQVVLCKAYTNGNLNWTGFGLLNGTTVVPYLPLNNGTPTMGVVQNADGTAAPQTGIPQIGSAFTFSGTATTPPRNLTIVGTYEAA